VYLVGHREVPADVFFDEPQSRPGVHVGFTSPRLWITSGLPTILELASLITTSAFTGTDRGLLRSFWVRGLPFPNARHLGHPFQWKNTLPWHLGPAKSESSSSKIFRHSGITLVFKYHV